MIETILLLVSGIAAMVSACFVAWSILADTWSIWPLAILAVSMAVLVRGLWAQDIRGDKAQ